jgi:hypothetical protein
LPDQFPESRIPEMGIEPEPPELPDELIDELLAGAKPPAEITGPDGCPQRDHRQDGAYASRLGTDRAAA